MARATGHIEYRATLDASGFRRGARELGSATDGVRTKSRGLIGTMGDLANATGITAREVIGAGYEMLQLGAAAEVTAESFRTTFGPAADGLAESIEAVGYSMGLTRSEAMGLLTPTGQLLQSMGLTKEQSAGTAEEMLELAGALAAFNPQAGDTQEALAALGSLMRGERDPIERFGISIKQVDVNAKALAMTGKELTAELTKEELALAAVTLAMEAGSEEIEAFEQNSDSAAGRLREMEARVRDLQVEMGAALLPILEENSDEIIVLIQALADILPVIAQVIGFVADLGSQFDDAKMDFGELEGAFRNWDTLSVDQKFRAVVQSVLRLSGPFGEIISLVDALFRKLGRPIPGLSGGIPGRGGSATAPISNRPNYGGSNPDYPWSFAMGGRVPGPMGAPVPIIAHGGETVVPAGMGGSGAGVTINITAGVGDPQAIARSVVDALRTYNREIGPVPIETAARGVV